MVTGGGKIPFRGPAAPLRAKRIIRRKLRADSALFQRSLRKSEWGARQESDESGGPAFWSALPEVLKTTTEFWAAESDDGIGAWNGPVPTGEFETGANGRLASSLDNADGSTEALGVELGIAHMVSVGLEVMETAARLIGARDLAADGVEQSPESSGVEFLLPAFGYPCRDCALC